MYPLPLSPFFKTLCTFAAAWLCSVCTWPPAHRRRCAVAPTAPHAKGRPSLPLALKPTRQCLQGAKVLLGL